MLAIDHRDRTGYVHELKFDGYRVQLRKRRAALLGETGANGASHSYPRGCAG
jgi:hypothetical protein